MNYLPSRDYNLSITHFICGSPALPVLVPYVFYVSPWTWPVSRLILYLLQSWNKAQGFQSVAFSGLEFGLRGPSHHQTQNAWPSDCHWKTGTQLNAIKCSIKLTSRAHHMDDIGPWGLSPPTLIGIIILMTQANRTSAPDSTAEMFCEVVCTTNKQSKMLTSYLFWKCQKQLHISGNIFYSSFAPLHYM